MLNDIPSDFLSVVYQRASAYHNTLSWSNKYTNEFIIRKMEATLINNMQLPTLITSKH
jgi:hypothetical protein